MQKYLPEQGSNQQGLLGVHATCCSLAAKINATCNTRLTDICIIFLNGWYRFGFETFKWYSAGATETTQYGAWGLLEDIRQFNSTSPVAQLPRPSLKLKAVDQIHQSSIKLTFGIPIPSYNVNATNFMNHPVPYRYPDLRYLIPNSTFYYPLKNFSITNSN